MPEDDFPRGFVCLYCDKPHVFHPWVFAHWSYGLSRECDCGRIYRICVGKAAYRGRLAREIDENGEVLPFRVTRHVTRPEQTAVSEAIESPVSS